MSKGESERIVIDTNIWISSVISNRFDVINELILRKKLIPLYCDNLLEELNRVLNRKKFKKLISKNESGLLIDFLKDFGIYIDTNSDFKVCNDEKDNFLFELAYDGKAKFILSGDKEVLAVKKFKNIKVLNYNQLLKLKSYSSL